MNDQTLVVSFDVGRVSREVIPQVIGERAEIIYLTEVNASERADILRRLTTLRL